jgi:hypothetical protein
MTVAALNPAAGRVGLSPSSPDRSDQDNARSLIARATDPASGQVDTRQLGQWVAEAHAQDPQAASQAHAAIEAELGGASPAEAGRFNQDVAEAMQAPLALPSGQWATGQLLTARGDRVLVDNPILEKRWEFTRSAWTGKGGATGPLADLLHSHGIQVVPGVNAPPAGSLTPAAAAQQGVTRAQANNINGAVGRDAIADRFRAQGLQVQTEQPRMNGQRVVDVVAHQPANDSRYARVIETESKVGRAGATAGHRGQAALDAQALADNRAVRQGGELLGRAGRVVRPIGVVMDAVNVVSAFRADGNRVGENTGRAASGLVGGAGGAWAGAAAGAAIGSVVPGVGTVIGGIVGGIVGGLAGDAAGRGLFDAVKSWF